MSDEKAPDAIPMGMEIEHYADKHDIPLHPWQRMMLLRMFPNPSGEEQPKINLMMKFRRE